MVTVVPITSNAERVYPFQTFLPAEDSGLRLDSKAQAEQVRSVDVARIGPGIGRVPIALLRDLDTALPGPPAL